MSECEQNNQRGRCLNCGAEYGMDASPGLPETQNRRFGLVQLTPEGQIHPNNPPYPVKVLFRGNCGFVQLRDQRLFASKLEIPLEHSRAKAERLIRAHMQRDPRL
jgi:hypothetical protein